MSTHDQITDTRPVILLVDDKPENLSFISGLLGESYRVKIANSGEKALRIVRTKALPDLILLDVMMPGMDGYQVCSRLKRNPATCDIPVIFLTARADAEDEAFGLELGAVDYITKPVTPAILLARVKTHLALKTSADITRNQLAATIDAIPDLMFELDWEGFYLDIHSRHDHLLTAPRHEIIGRNICDILPAEAAETVMASIKHADSAGTDYGRVICLPRGQGNRWFELSVARKRLAGRLPHFIILSRDITNRKELEDELRYYARNLVEMDEKLRRELAAELHDEIGRDLTSLGLNLAIIRDSMPSEVRQPFSERLQTSQEVVVAISRRVRGLMAKLRPPVLDDYGLAAALRWYGEISAQRTGLTPGYMIEENFPRLQPDRELALFRIFHEAMSNIYKHAHASSIIISLAMHGTHPVLAVCDNGKGFDASRTTSRKEHSNWGMTIMRERAESIDAEFQVISSPGQGTAITITLPECI